MAFNVRRLIFGSPLPSTHADHTRLPKFLALPVFASDNLSSVAYATEEILLVLVLAGASMAKLTISVPIAIGIATLFAIVATSYRQTIRAYPQGGGAYRVSRENLGMVPGLVAGAALLMDYVLTVAVSMSAGVAAIASAFHGLAPYHVSIAVGCILFMMLVNLRGMKESGMLFALPTYSFMALIALLIGTGLYRHFAAPGSLAAGVPQPPQELLHHLATQPLTLFLVMKAFASGCTALTGVEAVSDGVPAFRPPEAKNASTTLLWMAVVIVFFFIGITFLANAAQIVPWPVESSDGHPINERHTVVSQLASAVFGRGSVLYYLTQGATAIILVLAANTAFADFPRLAMFLARDRFLPRQLANIGDRLVFSNGIIFLAILSSLLVIGFHGSTHHLIPLYAVGVFVSFTLSQAGMVRRHMRLREPGWQFRAGMSGFGALCTGVVMCVIAAAKFAMGAWIVIFLIPLLVLLFMRIHRHYQQVANYLTMARYTPSRPRENTVLVLVPGIHRGIMQALDYARSISPNVRAVYLEVDPEDTARVQEKWRRWVPDIPLVVLESPYRSLLEPLSRYIDQVELERDDDIITVILPEFVTPEWWAKLLHNQSGLMLKFALLFKKGVVVTNVRYYLDESLDGVHEPLDTPPLNLSPMPTPARQG